MNKPLEVCPVCKDGNIITEETNYHLNMVYSTTHCNNCEARFEEEYEYKRWTRLDEC